MSNRITRSVASAHNDAYTRHGEGDMIDLNDGRLLLIYMEFRGDGADEAPTRFATRTSADGGETWGDHRVLADTDPGDMNIYSPNVIRQADGGLLLTYMRQHSHGAERSTMHAWRSNDEGQSFQPITTFEERGPYSLCNGVMTSLKSGRILLPVCLETPNVANTYAVQSLYSDDHGHTWHRGETVVTAPMRGLMEPHVAETRDGRVLMAMRTQLGAVFMCESTDEGHTWSLPQTTGLRVPESCPELVTIPATGDLLMLWNNAPYDHQFVSHFGKRSPLTAAISKDEGRTWTHVRDIEDDPSRAFSNPGCRFSRDGRAMINYWTCEYLPSWRMQDIIDIRTAVMDWQWFYE